MVVGVPCLTFGEIFWNEKLMGWTTCTGPVSPAVVQPRISLACWGKWMYWVPLMTLASVDELRDLFVSEYTNVTLDGSASSRLSTTRHSMESALVWLVQMPVMVT